MNRIKLPVPIRASEYPQFNCLYSPPEKHSLVENTRVVLWHKVLSMPLDLGSVDLSAKHNILIPPILTWKTQRWFES